MSLALQAFQGDAEQWNGFARGQPGYTHFHRLEWKDVIERVFGHECLYQCARDESGALVAVLPLVRIRSLLFGHYLVSMPFLNYGGPLGSEEGVFHLVEAAAAEPRRSGARLMELRRTVALPGSLP